MRIILTLMLVVLMAYVSCTSEEKKGGDPLVYNEYKVSTHDQPISKTELGRALRILDDSQVYAIGKNEVEINGAKYKSYLIMTAMADENMPGDSGGVMPSPNESGDFDPFPAAMIIMGYSEPIDGVTYGDDLNWINMKIIDPSNDSIGYNADGTFFQTIATAEYKQLDTRDSVRISQPLTGDYTIIVYPEANQHDEAAYTIGIRINGSTMNYIDVMKALPTLSDATNNE